MSTEAILPEKLERARNIATAVKQEVKKVFVGSDYVIESLLIAMVARGHILLEGVPGIAKTTLVKAFAQVLDAGYRRIQFTPDLLPSDITGTYIVNMKDSTFVLRRGPIFANVVLGDEINRAPAKTQSALLEAMAENQVTIEGRTMELPPPFMVLATQNPVEQEGVYMLPEAQLDRFLIKLEMGYPGFEQEMAIIRSHDKPRHDVKALLQVDEVLELANLAEQVHIDDELLQYIVRLVHFTRGHAQVQLGASPRAAIALMKASKARALLRARDYVLPDDIQHLAPLVLAHRILLTPEAELTGFSGQEVVRQAIETTSYRA